MSIKAPVRKRRRLWKYIAALTALNEAEEGVAYIATTLGNGQGKDSLLNCLWTGVVASYCRPFTHNNDVGPIDVSLIPEGKMKRTHCALWGLRNKLCGHTDYETTFDSGQTMFPVAVEIIDGELCAHCPGGRLDVVAAPEILILIEHLKKECSRKWPDVLKKITAIECIPPGKNLINLSKDNDDLFIKK